MRLFAGRCDIALFCSVFTFNFYSPGQDYGLERTFGVEKTVIIENKFTFSFIEIPLSKGICHLFSLFISLFFIPKSFKTIAASIINLLIPPCRVCEDIRSAYYIGGCHKGIFRLLPQGQYAHQCLTQTPERSN